MKLNSFWTQVIAVALGVVIFNFLRKAYMERFVPTKPSMYQDKRYVTPAGNTIVY